MKQNMIPHCFYKDEPFNTIERADDARFVVEGPKIEKML